MIVKSVSSLDFWCFPQSVDDQRRFSSRADFSDCSSIVYLLIIMSFRLYDCLSSVQHQMAKCPYNEHNSKIKVVHTIHAQFFVSVKNKPTFKTLFPENLSWISGISFICVQLKIMYLFTPDMSLLLTPKRHCNKAVVWLPKKCAIPVEYIYDAFLKLGTGSI